MPFIGLYAILVKAVAARVTPGSREREETIPMGIVDMIAGSFIGTMGSKSTEAGLAKLPHIQDTWEAFLERFPQEWQAMRADIAAIALHSAPTSQKVYLTTLYTGEDFKIDTRGYTFTHIHTSGGFNAHIWMVGSQSRGVSVVNGWNTALIPDGGWIQIDDGQPSPKNVVIHFSNEVVGQLL